jgi:hypothetical protein
MLISFDDIRESDSPFIERVWSCHSERGGKFLSVASVHWEMVVTHLQGQCMLTVRGPETEPTEVPCPPNGEWLAIRFRLGTFMPQIPVRTLINSLGTSLPLVSRRAFLLDGRKWELPTYDNAEVFVGRLVNKGLVARDRELVAAIDGEPTGLSTRTAQRRFLEVAGMTQTRVRQIERARFAVQLLREGVSIPDVVWRCGFYDHAHLTRSVQRWIGLPPTAIGAGATQLSFLYKTQPPYLR